MNSNNNDDNNITNYYCGGGVLVASANAIKYITRMEMVNGIKWICISICLYIIIKSII